MQKNKSGLALACQQALTFFLKQLFQAISTLWLRGYEFDFGQGLTELKGTVGLWQRYALC